MKQEILSKDGNRVVSINRRRAIRERCLNCSCWAPKEVERCTFRDCPLYGYRSGKGKQNAKDRTKAIRAYCLWCMAAQKAEVGKCVSVHCALFGFRRGKAEKAIPMLKKAHRGAYLEAKALG